MKSKKDQRVVVTSSNPVKTRAALAGLQRMFPGQEFVADAVAVPSGVADQPFSDGETLQGALNRLQKAWEEKPGAAFYVSLEGGVEAMGDELAAFAWVVVRSAAGTIGKARSGTFFLPKSVAKLVSEGVELGTANDQIFSQMNSKQKGGAIGILSEGVLDRKELYEQAVLLALVPFKNPYLY